MEYTTSKIAAITGGKVLRGSPDARCRGFSTDTRTIKSGQCFIALVGNKYDAHKFLGKAAGKGAAMFIVQDDRKPRAIPGKTPVIAVKDTQTALGDLARDWRTKFKADVVAVTGSTGKTTTKEMTAHIIAG